MKGGHEVSRYRSALSERELREVRANKRLQFLTKLLAADEAKAESLLKAKEPAIGLTRERRVAVMRSIQGLSKTAYEEDVKRGDFEWLATVWQHKSVACFVAMRAGTYARDVQVQPIAPVAATRTRRPRKPKVEPGIMGFAFPATFTRDVKEQGVDAALRRVQQSQAA